MAGMMALRAAQRRGTRKGGGWHSVRRGTRRAAPAARGPVRRRRCRRRARLGLTAPEAVLVKRRALAQPVADPPRQPGPPDGQGLAAAVLLLLPLLPLPRPLAAAQEHARPLRKRPAHGAAPS